MRLRLVAEDMAEKRLRSCQLLQPLACSQALQFTSLTQRCDCHREMPRDFMTTVTNCLKKSENVWSHSLPSHFEQAQESSEQRTQ